MKHPAVNLTDRVAIVTGGSKGLGEAMALGLARHGATVVVVSRHIEESRRVAEEILQMGNRSLALSCDVTNANDVDRMVSDVVKALGHIDILVNNAGVNVRNPALEIREEDWDTVLTTNLKGVFLVAQRVGQEMVRCGHGKIINTASMFGLVGAPMLAPYCASKGGVIQLTRTLALEWSKHNVQVNAIAPGYIKTALNSEWLSDPERLRGILDMVPMSRLGCVEDVVGPVLFLASEWSDYVTGAVIPVDGGWTAR